MQEILGQACGILVMIGCIVSSQLPKRWQIMIGFALVNLFSSFNQLLVGAGLTACFLNAVATVHCSINAYKAKKEIPERLWENILFGLLYLAAWSVGFVSSLRRGVPLYLDLMTFAATVLFLGSVLLPRERDIRLCSFGNSFIYFVYDCINLNVAAVAKLINMVSLVIALIRYRKQDHPSDPRNQADG